MLLRLSNRPVRGRCAADLLAWVGSSICIPLSIESNWEFQFNGFINIYEYCVETSNIYTNIHAYILTSSIKTFVWIQKFVCWCVCLKKKWVSLTNNRFFTLLALSCQIRFVVIWSSRYKSLNYVLHLIKCFNSKAEFRHITYIYTYMSMYYVYTKFLIVLKIYEKRKLSADLSSEYS